MVDLRAMSTGITTCMWGLVKDEAGKEEWDNVVQGIDWHA